MNSPGQLGRGILWLAALAVAGVWLLQSIRISSDLTAFLPAASGEAESFLLEALENGSASRLMPVAIEAPDLNTAAALSKSLARILRKDGQFTQVLNGQQDMQARQLDWIMQHRYLLSDAVDAQRFTVESLRSALQDRLWELGSAEELAVKDLLARDPTHETLQVAAQWRPRREPPTHRGVWVEPEMNRALLMAETAAPGFDLDAQQVAVTTIRNALAGVVNEKALDPSGVNLLMTGPGPFGVELRRTTQRESQWFSTIAVTILLIFLFVIYRSVPWVIMGALPLGTGILVALLVVNAAFGGLHGITLAFGVTLLGVAIDYPLHLFSHHSAGQSATDSVRNIWPTMRLGVISTCLAYLTMVLSDFEGLAQLGWLTIIGLLVAAAATRWGLPMLICTQSATEAFDAATGWASAWHGRLSHGPRIPWWMMMALVVLLAAFLATRPQLWQDDLGSLTPVPQEKQKLDQALRQALAAPDLRYMAVIRAADVEQALQASEQLGQSLEAILPEGWLQGYDSPARYLPSQAIQQQRQAGLPDADSLASRLAEARSGLPFKADLFDPFVMEAAQARVQPLLTIEDLQASPVGPALTALLSRSADGHWRALLPMQGVSDAMALTAWFERQPGADLLDLKQSSENMVAGFRDEMLWRIGLATLAILALLVIGLQPRRRWLFVLLPVLAAVLSTASFLHLLGIKLSLFHMTSLMLVAGIVLDYALFFDREERNPEESVRTLHALSVCCVSTLTVFGILGLSQIPVLRAIGATVACGVVLGYFLAMMGRRQSG